ncbi:hypothetical protein [Actinoplanes sp. RD1]|uniref:hypothetical protein n=1 Tax=Actinoplanes sp. RD1 TaxID=3064538 RepID=UPI0027412905|nr:hypothetical protein [Actinoplanes sp. RD1]
MRTNLRRAVILVVTAAALIPGVAAVASAPAVAVPECPAGSNWDGILKICR